MRLQSPTGGEKLASEQMFISLVSFLSFLSAASAAQTPNSGGRRAARSPGWKRGELSPDYTKKSVKIPLSPTETSPVEMSWSRCYTAAKRGTSTAFLVRVRGCKSGSRVWFPVFAMRAPAQHPTSYAVFSGSHPLPCGKMSHPQLNMPLSARLRFSDNVERASSCAFFNAPARCHRCARCKLRGRSPAEGE